MLLRGVIIYREPIHRFDSVVRQVVESNYGHKTCLFSRYHRRGGAY